MRIVNIFGGLGNQMFQYALIKVLENQLNETVLADTHCFKGYTRHNGLEIEKIFSVELQLASKEDVKKLAFYASSYRVHKVLKWLRIKKTSTIQEILSKPYHQDVFRTQDTYYDGYWQNSRYYESIRPQLIEIFKFRIPLDERNQKLCQIISNSDSVGIHIRRGDYLKKKRYRGICDLVYYERAIREARNKFEHPHFYFFSNDIAWCQENLQHLMRDGEYTFVDWNVGFRSYVDMQLMSNCRMLIIANSSFSWWAAYLNTKAKCVIAPKKWFNVSPPLQIQLKEWQLI